MIKSYEDWNYLLRTFHITSNAKIAKSIGCSEKRYYLLAAGRKPTPYEAEKILDMLYELEQKLEDFDTKCKEFRKALLGVVEGTKRYLLDISYFDLDTYIHRNAHLSCGQILNNVKHRVGMTTGEWKDLTAHLPRRVKKGIRYFDL